MVFPRIQPDGTSGVLGDSERRPACSFRSFFFSKRENNESNVEQWRQEIADENGRLYIATIRQALIHVVFDGAFPSQGWELICWKYAEAHIVPYCKLLEVERSHTSPPPSFWKFEKAKRGELKDLYLQAFCLIVQWARINICWHAFGYSAKSAGTSRAHSSIACNFLEKWRKV